MSNDDFFERQKENSKVKTEIVCKYFDAFSTVFKNKKKDIAYIDLCCGPGYYENREKSTPIILIENILEDKTKSDKNTHLL
jgi:three-Cys-motif partner protein